MKKTTLIAAFTLLFCTAASAKDVYRLDLTLKVPRVFSNNSSQGWRKNQVQRIRGEVEVDYSKENGVRFSYSPFINRTHILASGSNVTYDVGESFAPTWNLIGNNKTGRFTTPTVSFTLEMLPSYTLGDQPTEDNAIVLTLSGSGSTRNRSERTVIMSLSGYAAGRVGCGCTEYGHISPTRKVGAEGATEEADDVAAVFGTWRMKYLRTE